MIISRAPMILYVLVAVCLLLQQELDTLDCVRERDVGLAEGTVERSVARSRGQTIHVKMAVLQKVFQHLQLPILGGDVDRR